MFGVFLLSRRNTNGITMIVLGGIGAALSIADIRTLQQGGAKGPERITQHLTMMLAGTIATITAFVVTNFTVQPPFIVPLQKKPRSASCARSAWNCASRSTLPIPATPPPTSTSTGVRAASSRVPGARCDRRRCRRTARRAGFSPRRGAAALVSRSRRRLLHVEVSEHVGRGQVGLVAREHVAGDRDHDQLGAREQLGQAPAHSERLIGSLQRRSVGAVTNGRRAERSGRSSRIHGAASGSSRP